MKTKYFIFFFFDFLLLMALVYGLLHLSDENGNWAQISAVTIGILLNILALANLLRNYMKLPGQRRKKM